MDQILAAYRKSSKQWSTTLNKLAQGQTLPLLLCSTLTLFLHYMLLTSIHFHNLQCDKEGGRGPWLDESVSNFISLLRYKKKTTKDVINVVYLHILSLFVSL